MLAPLWRQVSRQARLRPAPRAAGQLLSHRRRGGNGLVPPHSRGASTVFNVKPKPGNSDGEQTLFVVGLNKGKFFGQDGSEEALKLLEQIAQQQGPSYTVLVGISDRDLKKLEEDHKVQKQRLTPSRDLEGYDYCEFIPVLQASMVDKTIRRAVGRILRTTQAHVAMQLWKHPREAVRLYWAFWERKKHKNAACREFWSKHFPVASAAYFDEISEVIAISAVDHMMAAHQDGKTRTWVLVVSNLFFQPTTESLRKMLDDSAPQKFGDRQFAKELHLKHRDLCLDVADLTPLLVFIYCGVPLLFIQSLVLALEKAYELSGFHEWLLPPEDNRD